MRGSQSRPSRPRYAIISVGRRNLFGHPAPSTIETLRRLGAQAYRTDDIGAVWVTSDGIAPATIRSMAMQLAR